jgi:phosphonate transport system permease protein
VIETRTEILQRAERRVRLEKIRNAATALLALLVIGWAFGASQINPFLLVEKAPYMWDIIRETLAPNWDALDRVLARGVETLQIAILGTFFGMLIAIPLSFVAARNLMRVNPVTRALYYVVRATMSIIRSVPTLIWALLFVSGVGLGPFPGVLAITIFSVGLMSKLFSEAVEAIDWGQVEAITATGATPLAVVRYGVVPQVVPYMVSHLLYTFEVNVHSATVLGIVGAGGIGFLLVQYIGIFDFHRAGTALLVTVLLTLTIDYSSAALRRRII